MSRRIVEASSPASTSSSRRRWPAPAARRCLAGGDRRRSAEGTGEQLPDGGVHLGVQRDRPAGGLRPRPPRRGHRPARRRPARRRTLAGGPPAQASRILELAHPGPPRRPSAG
ncbi:hypothetical protein LT493_23500 [Streptomyces tricolor]|nr:hypothetical protein [Streptomyces tricolor]